MEQAEPRSWFKGPIFHEAASPAIGGMEPGLGHCLPVAC
jgi:hypothetical protein